MKYLSDYFKKQSDDFKRRYLLLWRILKPKPRVMPAVFLKDSIKDKVRLVGKVQGMYITLERYTCDNGKDVMFVIKNGLVTCIYIIVGLIYFWRS